MDSKKTLVNILGCCITANLGGTSADLLENDSLTVHELLYGMMLPSGNDAAQALAIYFGHLQQLVKTKKISAKQIDANIVLKEFHLPEAKKQEKSVSDQEEDKT